LTKNDIIHLLLLNRQKIRGFGAKRLGLFGSFVKDRQTATSDIDLIADFEQGKKNYDNFVGLAYYLEELLDRRVELVTSNSLSPYIKPYIEEEVEYITFSS